MTLREAERLGAATTLLSLDRAIPFYPAMGVRPAQGDGENLKTAVRWAIVRNREAFMANQQAVPDLSKPLSLVLQERFGDVGAHAFFDWYANDFVHSPDDFKYFGNWYLFFGALNRGASRWERLALPAAMRIEAQTRFAKAKNNSDLWDIDKKLDALPMSEWDAHMYALHRLYAEGREPILWILETVRKRRFLEFLKWLAGQFDEPAKRAFITSALVLKGEISSFSGAAAFPDLFESVA